MLLTLSWALPLAGAILLLLVPNIPSPEVPDGASEADAAMRGGRAVIALKRAEALGHVTGVRPAVTDYEKQEFDGKFSFRLHTDVTDQVIEAAIRGAGDVDQRAWLERILASLHV